MFMTILFPIDDLLHALFPSAKGDLTALLDLMRTYYSVGGIQPDVRVAGDAVEVVLDVERIAGHEKLAREATKACEQGRLKDARPLLEELVKADPRNSGFHAMLGQVYEELGEKELALDQLIEALRWDPTDQRALIMMGNIWAAHRKEPETALTYYNEALRLVPNDHLVANNIAAQFLNLEKLDLAETWFDKAMAIEPSYPNTHHGLAIVSERKGDLDSALFEATEAMRLNPKRDQLYQQSHGLARHVANELVGRKLGAAVVQQLCEEQHKASGKPVRSVADESIPTAARLEVAETYDRPEHVVRYKPGYPCVEHLEVHELYHLRYITEARGAGLNELFTAGPSNKEAFLKARAKDRARMLKQGISEEAVDRFLIKLFDGMNRQIYNAPLDLFIEFDMYHEFPDMRPYQFLSLERLVDEGVQGTTNKRIVELAPSEVVSKSKVYNLTLAMLYQELYGVDRIADLNPTGLEKQQAKRLYEEFVEYREDREPAEEYELVRHWAEDLKLTPYFALVKEAEHRAKTSAPLEDQLDRIQADPLDQHSKDPERDREMKTFQEGQAAIGTNMAVVMFMVDALKFFNSKTKEEIRNAAFEIAMLGTQGIVPDKQGYKLANVPGTTFSGYHLLAYYYVSFKLVLPEVLPDLQLPYDEEFAMAEQLYSATP